MKIYYLTGSQIPSINANTINVLSMCYVLSKYSEKLDFFFSSKNGTNKKEIIDIFGISLNQKVSLNFVKVERLHEIFIFFKSLKKLIIDFFFKKCPDLVICRNIYGAFFYPLFFDKVVYETHTVEQFFFREFMQDKILKKKKMCFLF